MKSLKGHVLVASPKLVDPNFHRTVILLIEHNEEAAAGVVLNRPTEAMIAEVSEQVLELAVDWEKPIYLGGPVPGPLIALHDLEGLADRQIIEGLYSAIDPDKIRELIQRRAEPSLFIANYAGWGAGQLEMELIQESWLYTPAALEPNLLEGDPALWETLLKRINAAQLAEILGIEEMPDDPGLN